jgi:hypothetical protein
VYVAICAPPGSIRARPDRRIIDWDSKFSPASHHAFWESTQLLVMGIDFFKSLLVVAYTPGFNSRPPWKAWRNLAWGPTQASNSQIEAKMSSRLGLGFGPSSMLVADILSSHGDRTALKAHF